MSVGCETVKYYLEAIVAFLGALFGISEFLGYSKPGGCASVSQLTVCSCTKVKQIVEHISPRVSLDLVRRVSREMPRVAEEEEEGGV